MIVLGIDPGIAISGCAIIEELKGKHTLIHSRAITTPPTLLTSQRLEKIYDALMDVIKTYNPDCSALESLFFNTNAKTALIVGQARGVIQLVLEQNKLPISEYTPLQVKMALSGYGRAEKEQMQQMVKQILHLPKILLPMT